VRAREWSGKTAYIPEKDELQEAVESTASIKLTLSTKVELRLSVWSRDAPEKFIMHVQQAIAAIKGKGLMENYEKYVRAKKECMEKLEEAVLNRDLVEGEVKGDSPIAKAVQTATEAQAKAMSVVEHIISQIFQIYSNFLSEEARQPWNKILAEQIESSPWKDLGA
jgi:hypothetical protein